jgi:hypothetical protein
MTLEELQRKTPFTSWEGSVDADALDASRRAYATLMTQLVALGPEQPADAYLPALNGYIEEFNRLDEEFEFIETIEREDICECLQDVLDVLDLPDIGECDDLPAVRNW